MWSFFLLSHGRRLRNETGNIFRDHQGESVCMHAGFLATVYEMKDKYALTTNDCGYPHWILGERLSKHKGRKGTVHIQRMTLFHWRPEFLLLGL